MDLLSADTNHCSSYCVCVCVCVLSRSTWSHGLCLGDTRHSHLRSPDDVHHHAPHRLLHCVGVWRWNDADALLASHQVQQSNTGPPFLIITEKRSFFKQLTLMSASAGCQWFVQEMGPEVPGPPLTPLFHLGPGLCSKKAPGVSHAGASCSLVHFLNS